MDQVLEQFVKRLQESGLITDDSLKELLPPVSSPKTAEELGRELIRQKKLTRFQAEQIYSGNGRSLTLGNYVILEKLGQGGMGVVLKAEHRRMKRVVALKVISPAAVKTPDAVKRFHREVEAAAKLTHPNLVIAFDADEANGAHFLVMEFIDGIDLAALVKKEGPLSIAKSLDCIRQAATGLEFAHQHGVIHRDIKPANLLIDSSGKVKVLDLGLARIEGDASVQTELTTTGAVMGTVDYMAPEQALNTKSADARSDIYSLGISLWYLMTGKSAYEGDTMMAKLLAHRDAPIPTLRSVRSDVAQSVEDVFRRMVAKQPADRFQSMTQVREELESLIKADAGANPTAINVAAANAEVDSQLRDFLKTLDVAPKTSAIGNQPIAGTATYHPLAGDSDQPDATRISRSSHGDATLGLTSPAMNGPRKSTRLQWTDRRVQIGIALATIVILMIPVTMQLGKKSPKKVEKSQQTTEAKQDRRPVEVNGTPQSAEFQKWLHQVANLPANQQLEAVIEKLRELNPEFDGKHTHKIERGQVVFLEFLADRVVDISPIRALKGLERLECHGFGANSGRLYDLSPLKGMSLKVLKVFATQAADLEPLRGMPLEELSISFCPVKDLSPLVGMPLTRLYARTCKVSDFSPIKNLPLTSLELDFDVARDLELLTSITSLEKINGKPRALFMSDIPAEREIAEVIASLCRANPGFNGKCSHQIVDGVVRELRFVCDYVRDITPVAQLKGLTTFVCTGSGLRSGKVMDVTPLKLGISITPVTDLSPLATMTRLTRLECRETSISDLSPLGNCKNLTSLGLRKTKVTASEVEKLQKLLPNCKIDWQEPDHLFADWLISKGAQFDVITEDRRSIAVDKPADLPTLSFNMLAVRTLIDVEDADFDRFKGLGRLKSVILNVEKTSTSALNRMSQISDLEMITLHRSRFTASTYGKLDRFPRLKSLRFSDCRFSGEFAEFKALPQLQQVTFDSCQMDPSDIETLTQLKRLREVEFSNQNITDNEIPILARFTQLELLTLQKTNLSKTGLQDLKKRLPKCTIKSDVDRQRVEF
ncbi:MAG: protein kinase [Planctomycetaceae bacterium]